MDAFAITDSLQPLTRSVQAWWGANSEEILENYKEYGLANTILINFALPEAGHTIYRVRNHLLGQEEEHIRLFKKSFTESFAMIGVAGAIIAQIAITGLSLDKLDETHWTAYAAFVVSVIAGCLAVYYSCTLQLSLSGLHGPQEILEWLTAPKMIYRTTHPFNNIPFTIFGLDFGPRLQPPDPPDVHSSTSIVDCVVSYISWAIWQMILPGEPMDTSGMRFNSPEWIERRTPSLTAAVLLVAPAQLLTLSLVAFLAGQGIYLGILYGNQISVIRGKQSELRILVTYIVVTGMSVLAYGVFRAMETSENWLLKKRQDNSQTVELQNMQSTPGRPCGTAAASVLDENASPPPPPQRTAGIFANTSPEETLRRVDRLDAALESLIRMQAEHLEAQSAILRNLRETTQ